uniref:Ubiquitin n=1 Tax=Rhizophora mucronata TaxID=61149 RepID=A0A2P2LYM6_RHIMU
MRKCLFSFLPSHVLALRPGQPVITSCFENDTPSHPTERKRETLLLPPGLHIKL